MNKEDQKVKITYLLAWSGTNDGIPTAFFEHSTAKLCREQGVVSAGLERGKHRVVVFCDFIHGDDYLTKDELRLVAACYLDTDYNTINIDFRYYS